MKASIFGNGIRANGAMIANAATVEITRKTDVIFSRRLGGASISTIRFGWTGLGVNRFAVILSSSVRRGLTGQVGFLEPRPSSHAFPEATFRAGGPSELLFLRSLTAKRSGGSARFQTWNFHAA
jgi:hypothetical protein